MAILAQEMRCRYYPCNRARYYDPGTGRFLQRDPEPGARGVPATVINSYIYVLNDPVSLSDPTGHGFWAGLGFVFAAIGTTIVAVIAAPVIGVAGAIIIGALAAGFASAAIPAFSNQFNWSQVGSSFWGGFFTAAIIGIGGFAIGALVGTAFGVGAGIAAGAAFGTVAGGYIGYKNGGWGMALVGAFLGGFGAGAAAYGGYSGLAPHMPTVQPPAPAPIGAPIWPVGLPDLNPKPLI